MCITTVETVIFAVFISVSFYSLQSGVPGARYDSSDILALHSYRAF